MSKKIETLTKFLDLVATHNVGFKIEGDGKSVHVTVSYPKTMPPKVRNAMRDWAADNETKLALAVFALARGWEPEGLDVHQEPIEGDVPFQPVTAIH